jgi:hypothetical protein
LHNILLSFSDEWADDIIEAAEPDEDEVVRDDLNNQTAQDLRIKLQNTVLNWYYSNN